MADILLPLSVFEVRYELASGRPYADLDRLVLEAVSGGIQHLDALSDVFRLKPRLIIEVLITLARAGWLSIDIAKGTFEVTRLGHCALGEEKLPPFTRIERVTDMIMLEGWTGRIISQNEITYTKTVALQKSGAWDKARRLPPGITDDHLDHGEVIALLRRGESQWIRSVETPVLIARGRHWLRVRIEAERGKIRGLPDRWEKTLGPMLLEEVARFEGRRAPARKPQPPQIGEEDHFAESEFRAGDLLLNHEQHVAALRDALAEAHSFVLVASAFLDSGALDGEPKQWIIAALKRGVQVHLLWGYGLGRAESGEKETLKWLRKLRKEADSFGANLRFSSEPTESHAKLLIADRGGEFEAIVGSFNWLSTPPFTGNSDQTGSNVSMRLRHPALLADLFQTAAALWMTSRAGLLSDAPERLRHLGARCAQLALEADTAVNEPKVRIRLVRDVEHEHLLRTFIQQTSTARLVVSHQLGRVGLSRLANLPQVSTEPLSVFYGRLSESMDSEAATQLEGEVTSTGTRFEHLPWLHAKIAVAGNTSIISSYNFLSADPFRTARRTRELGLLIDCGVVAEALRKAFTQLASPKAPA